MNESIQSSSLCAQKKPSLFCWCPTKTMFAIRCPSWMACLRMGASARRARHVRSTATLCHCHVEHHNVQTTLLVFFFFSLFFFHFPSPLADLDAMHQTRLHCCRRNAYRHFQLTLSTSQLPVTHCAYILKARFDLLKMRMDSTSSSSFLPSSFS